MNQICDGRYGKMIYNPNDVWIGRSYDLYGEFSEKEVSFLRGLVNEGDVCIDIGANIGAITIPLAQKVGSGGLVVAIEPQQQIFYSLCGNIALNNLSNVTTLQRAVSNKEEMVWVPTVDYSLEGNFGGVSLESQNELKQLGAANKAYPVATLTIDQLNLIKANLIKVDVEGMELEVLEGALKTIYRSKPYLYVECDREHKAEPLSKFLASIGYSFAIHFPPLFNKDNFKNNEENALDKPGRQTVSSNLFCWHNSREQEAQQFLNDEYMVTHVTK